MRFAVVILAVLIIAHASAQSPGTEEPASVIASTSVSGTSKGTTPPPHTTHGTTSHTNPPTSAPSTAGGKTTNPPTSAPSTAGGKTTNPPTSAHTTAGGNATRPGTTHSTPGASTKAASTTLGPTTQPPTIWAVNDSAGNACLLAQFFLVFSGTYEFENNTQGDFMFKLPQNSAVDKTKSKCGTDKEPATLVLTFDEDVFVLQFTKDVASNMYKLSSAVANLTHSGAHFPDSNNTGMVKYGGTPSEDFFSATVGKSFKCASKEDIAFKPNNFNLHFTDLKVQPFVEGGQFGSEHACFADNPGTWFLKNEKGEVCLVADFVVEFRGMYDTTKKQKKPFSFKLPENALVDKTNSKCATTKVSDTETEEATLTLTTKTGDTFIQVFTADTKKKTFSLTKATAKLMHTESHFPDSSDKGKVVTYGGDVPKPALGADLGSYYKCNANVNLKFKDGFELNYSDTKIQPFEVNGKFGKESPCPADTPTVKPAVPPVGNWSIPNKDGICMFMQFGVEFLISYEMANKTTGKAGFFFPNDTKLVHLGDSTCNDSLATFEAVFNPDSTDLSVQWVLAMKFTMANKKYAMTDFSLKYIEDPKYFPHVNGTEEVTATNSTKRFETPSGSYYLCSAEQSFNASRVMVSLIDIKIQPFAQVVNKKGGYGSASECSADNDVSNIVPIAVGCALAGLVIIVLIAYLIGRSRTNRSGYQSV